MVVWGYPCESKSSPAHYSKHPQLALGVFFYAREKIKLERVAVLEEYRNNGYGEMLVREVIKDIKAITTKPITLNSQLPAIPLYARIGFKQYGELFYEADIPHYAMLLED